MLKSALLLPTYCIHEQISSTVCGILYLLCAKMLFHSSMPDRTMQDPSSFANELPLFRIKVVLNPLWEIMSAHML